MASPTPELQQAIQSLHAAIATEQDPKHIQILSQCLQNMARVQAEIMQGGGGGGGNGGGPPGGGSPPPGPSTPADPRAFLQQLGR